MWYYVKAILLFLIAAVCMYGGMILIVMFLMDQALCCTNNPI